MQRNQTQPRSLACKASPSFAPNIELCLEIGGAKGDRLEERNEGENLEKRAPPSACSATHQTLGMEVSISEEYCETHVKWRHLLDFQRRDLIEGIKPVATFFGFCQPNTTVSAQSATFVRFLAITIRKARRPNDLGQDSRALPLRACRECRLLQQILSSSFLWSHGVVVWVLRAR